MTSFTTHIILDEDGNHCIEFTQEQLEMMGLEVGDTIVWEEPDPGSGTVSFRKKPE